MKKYLFPVLIIILGGWLLKFENMFIKGSALVLILTLTEAFLMFAFGLSLQHKRKNRTWIKKLIVSFIFLFLLIWDLDLMKNVESVVTIFNVLCLNNNIVLSLSYILLGWLFFD